MAKAHRGLDGRHRDKSGKIEKKHGNTKVGSLRKEYGEGFAEGRRKDLMLKNSAQRNGIGLVARIPEASSQVTRKVPLRFARPAHSL